MIKSMLNRSHRLSHPHPFEIHSEWIQQREREKKCTTHYTPHNGKQKRISASHECVSKTHTCAYSFHSPHGWKWCFLGLDCCCFPLNAIIHIYVVRHRHPDISADILPYEIKEWCPRTNNKILWHLRAHFLILIGKFVDLSVLNI